MAYSLLTNKQRLHHVKYIIQNSWISLKTLHSYQIVVITTKMLLHAMSCLIVSLNGVKAIFFKPSGSLVLLPDLWKHFWIWAHYSIVAIHFSYRDIIFNKCVSQKVSMHWDYCSNRTRKFKLNSKIKTEKQLWQHVWGFRFSDINNGHKLSMAGAKNSVFIAKW